MEFEKPREAVEMEEHVDEFLQDEIVPLEQEYDYLLGEDAEMNSIEGTGDDYYLSNEFLNLWEDVRKKSVEAGIYSMYMPERVGGGGLDLLPASIVIEHIENRNPNGLHPYIWNTGTVSEIMLLAYEDDYQRKKYFAPMMEGEKISSFALTEPNHGSDATHLETAAEKEGNEWIINGTKKFIGNAHYSDYVLVFARTSGEPGDTKGITTFIVDRENPGMLVEKVQRAMGIKPPGKLGILNFDECHVPEKQVLGEVDKGITQMLTWIGMGRLAISARAVGRAQWMLDQSIEYAQNRTTFGNKITDYQGVAFQLSEAATAVEQVRLLYRYTAWQRDQGETAVKEQSMCKLQAAELWNDVADMAIQIHGGAGFTRSLPFERQYREARASRIYEGTDEIQKRTIAKQLFKG